MRESGLLSIGLLWASVAAAPIMGQERDPPEWGAEVVLRVGSPDDPETTLFRVVDLAVDPAGNIHALEASPPRVRSFTADGEPFGSWGRSGEGPGEFRSPGAIGVHGDSLLWIADPPRRMIHRFAADGTHLGSTRSLGSASVTPSQLVHDGSMVGVEVVPLINAPSSTAVVHLEPDGSVRSKLLDLPRDPRSGVEVRGVLGPGSVVQTANPFAFTRRTAWDPAGRHMVALTTDADACPEAGGTLPVDVLRIDFAGGASLEGTELALPTVPMDEERRSQIIEGTLDPWARTADADPRASFDADRAAALALEAFDPPSCTNPIEGLVVASDGGFWVRGASSDPDAALWTEVDPDGTPVGQIRISATIALMETHGGRLYGVETDGLGVERLVVVEVHRD